MMGWGNLVHTLQCLETLALWQHIPENQVENPILSFGKSPLITPLITPLNSFLICGIYRVTLYSTHEPSVSKVPCLLQSTGVLALSHSAIRASTWLPWAKMLHDQSQRSCEQQSAKSLSFSAYFREEILLLWLESLVTTGCPTSRLPGARVVTKTTTIIPYLEPVPFSGYNSLQI